MIKNNNLPFWKTKSLREMDRTEWESLCDGCGKCCLEKLRDEATDVIYTTRISCRLLDPNTCKCSAYEKRFDYVKDCMKLTPNQIEKITWLPQTCAYRLVKEKKDLPIWHPLITKNPNSTVESGNGANKYAVHPKLMDKNIIEYILDDEDI